MDSYLDSKAFSLVSCGRYINALKLKVSLVAAITHSMMIACISRLCRHGAFGTVDFSSFCSTNKGLTFVEETSSCRRYSCNLCSRNKKQFHHSISISANRSFFQTSGFLLRSPSIRQLSVHHSLWELNWTMLVEHSASLPELDVLGLASEVFGGLLDGIQCFDGPG